jgi:hypothetical protein
MAEDFSKYAVRWTEQDHAAFEALCFHRADEVVAPYTALMRAPEIELHEVAADIVKRAYEASKDAIARAYETKTESGAEIFTYAVGNLCEGPGQIPALISTNSWKHLDIFETNIMQERGGALNSYGTYYSSAFSAGLVWDSFWFFEEAFGEECTISFTTYHLTKLGLEYCLWRYPERVEKLRMAEAARQSI